jgi:hypothetical protein
MYNMMDFRESNPGLPIHRLTCYPLGHATPTHPPNLYILTYILNMHNQAKIKTTGYMIRKTSVFLNLHYKLINLNRLGTIDFTVQLSAGNRVRYDTYTFHRRFNHLPGNCTPPDWWMCWDASLSPRSLTRRAPPHPRYTPGSDQP